MSFARSEVVGVPLDMLLPERHRASHRQHVERFGDGPTQVRRMSERGEVFGRGKNGEELPVEASSARLGEGPERLYIVSMRDVTERHRVEREQRSGEGTTFRFTLPVASVSPEKMSA